MPNPRAIELTSHRVNGLNEALRVFAIGPKSVGNAHVSYLILLPDDSAAMSAQQVGDDPVVVGCDYFQISEKEELVVDNTLGTAMIVEGDKAVTYRVTYLDFQNGAVREVGYNGISNEALLAVLIHRLEGFQQGQFPAEENAHALTKLNEARLWLHKRTMDREARGVEGTHRA